MKKQIIFLIIQLVIFSYIYSQSINLVPNPSFEEYTNCPFSVAQIYYAVPWTAATGGMLGSSDFIHSCSTCIDIVDMFNNVQKPKTGNGYAAIILLGPFLENYREYLEVMLKYKLIRNRNYCGKFFVNLADFANYATANIGIYFSNFEVIQTSLSAPLIYTPVIKNTNGILKDKINWMKISGSFIAKGDEQYLVIGNFDSTQNVDYIFVGGTGNPRYLIDDVSVCDCEDFKPKLGRDTTLCTGQQLLLKANIPKEADSIIYTWQDGSKDSIFMVTQPGIYWVSAYIEDYKITVTDTIRVNYTDCTPPKYPLWIPNSFTPNSDGLNDNFKPETIAEMEEYKMLIFNRWGQQIFESNDISKGWDGKYKGKLVESGVYTYHIEATDKLTKEKKVYNGRVTLIF